MVVHHSMEAFVPVETVLKVKEVGSQFPPDRESTLPDMPAFPSHPADCQYFTVKSENKDEVEEQKVYCLTPQSEQSIPEHSAVKEVVAKSWTLHMDPNSCSDQKMNGSEKPCLYSLQALSFQDDSLFQVDYRTRNKLKTKHRRMDPDYRDQERLRQRTVMQLKRQNPQFRAEEREKGRCRMRIKRLDPLFRTKERERQRERMKIKRLDPSFREREREQQKSRIHEKRRDPEFREKERARGRLRTRFKTDGISVLHKLNTADDSGKAQLSSVLENSRASINGTSIIMQDTELSKPAGVAQGNMCDRPQQLPGVTSVVLRSGETLFDSFRYIPPNAFNIHLHCDVREHYSPDKNCKPVYSMIKNSLEDAINHGNGCFAHLPHLSETIKPKVINVKNKVLDASKIDGPSPSSQSVDK